MTPNSTYQEVIRPPWWTLVALAFCFGLLSFAFMAVAGPIGAGIAFVLLMGLALYGLSRGTLELAVTPEAVQVGKLSIPLADVVGSEPLDAAATRRLVGQDADVRATLLLRNLSTPKAVRIQAGDGARMPYWVVSTRHPDEFSAAIEQQVQGLRTPPRDSSGG